MIIPDREVQGESDGERSACRLHGGNCTAIYAPTACQPGGTETERVKYGCWRTDEAATLRVKTHLGGHASSEIPNCIGWKGSRSNKIYCNRKQAVSIKFNNNGAMRPERGGSG